MLQEVLSLARNAQLPGVVGMIGRGLGAKACLASIAATFLFLFLFVLVLAILEGGLAEKAKAVRLDGVAHGSFIVQVYVG